MDFLLNETPVPWLLVYLDEHGTFALVSAEDYPWASRFSWRPKPDKTGRKLYAVRSMDVGCPVGKDRAGRRQVSIHLHKEVCLRAFGPPSTPRHVIGDHLDGNSLDCRRSNLRWATRSENNMNLNGWYARQMRLPLEARDARLR